MIIALHSVGIQEVTLTLTVAQTHRAPLSSSRIRPRRWPPHPLRRRRPRLRPPIGLSPLRRSAASNAAAAAATATSPTGASAATRLTSPPSTAQVRTTLELAPFPGRNQISLGAKFKQPFVVVATDRRRYRMDR